MRPELREQTSKEISERIHNDFQNTLLLAKLKISQLELAPKPVNTKEITAVKKLIVATITKIKEISKDLDSEYITRYTLEENIERQLKQVEKRGINTVFTTSEEEINIDDKKLIFIYRIVQEAISNGINHAKASCIKISLYSDIKDFIVCIEDDGKGFDADTVLMNKKKSGLGIVNMQHRTQLMNGTFAIDSILHKGTKITLKIPYHD